MYENTSTIINYLIYNARKGKATPKCESEMQIVSHQAKMQLDIQVFWKPGRNSEFRATFWRRQVNLRYEARVRVDSIPL